jgi:3-hydroxybutyryl-CoA dehydrogenase
MSLVEVVASTSTSDDVVQTCISFAKDVLKKTPIVCVDRSGFVVNALLIPYLCSAVRMLENKVATAADIDTGMVEGCAHPIGPLALCDLIGLDTVAAIANTLADELEDEYLRPPALLNTMIAAGDLGRKTGQGFFSY